MFVPSLLEGTTQLRIAKRGAMFFGFLRRRGNFAVHEIYRDIVSQARQPVFYQSFGVPDTAEGRFEMIVFHAFCLFHRLRHENKQAGEVAQKVFDLFFVDMDQSLREAGIGDEGVRRRIRKMSESFYGRSTTYSRALEEGDNGQLAQAFARNFLFTADGGLAADRLVEYMHATLLKLNETKTECILKNEFDWVEVKWNAVEEGVGNGEQ
ncbi:ubiquinol-cytochrome C chaperone family protein [Flexibacterium corallicola]|uniref:ubiquinol-cytochrome C chaperone family protein n=1 Tax=Flexibacterium corallicola TaxID=3037259 RepID=UPI00286ECD5F|nr:ubiquinol-cytochrome C chaperone family protein [Pseudovibrio sp. M1P-2-3]